MLTLVQLLTLSAAAQDTYWSASGPVRYRCTDANGAELGRGVGSFAYDVNWDSTAAPTSTQGARSTFVFGPNRSPGDIALDVVLTGQFPQHFTLEGGYVGKSFDADPVLDDGFAVTQSGPNAATASHSPYSYRITLATDLDVYQHGGLQMPDTLEDLDSGAGSSRGAFEGPGYKCAWWIPDDRVTLECTYDTDLDGVCELPVQDGDGDGSSLPDDCDDNDPDVFPGATEDVGDDIDQDCDGADDCWEDADQDGARSDVVSFPGVDLTCTAPGEADQGALVDCDESDAGVFPGATEIPGDGIDQDCDGSDSSVPDGDSDGFNDAVDCDDVNPAINPGAAEIAGDNVDQNCDNAELCFADGDDDGTRTAATSAGNGDVDCNDPGEALAADPSGDCNDADPAIEPGVSEIAGDNVDQNCDNAELCFVDGDDDGTRTTTTSAGNGDVDCNDPGEALAADPSGDCNDGNPAIEPGVSEIAGDNVDQNCDNAELCFVDGDDDGTRTTATSAGNGDVDCNDPGEGLAADPSGDCNDGNPAIEPGVAEIAGDDVDQNCDNVEDCYVDGDDDGARTSTVDVGGSNNDGDCSDAGEAVTTDLDDCDDSDVTRYPGATEIANDGIDQDCDGSDLVTTTWADVQPIFAGRCAGCHFNVPAGYELGGLRFDGPEDIVNVASPTVAMDWIEPGDPANSYFWHKINDTQAGVPGGGGTRMPQGGPAINQTNKDLIQAWILGGALP